jgi:hypothetical protein
MTKFQGSPSRQNQELTQNYPFTFTFTVKPIEQRSFKHDAAVRSVSIVGTPPSRPQTAVRYR